MVGEREKKTAAESKRGCVEAEVLAPREACRSAGHIFDGILGIKSRIKVMPTLKFVVPEPWHG